MPTAKPALPPLERVDSTATIAASPVQKLMVSSDWAGNRPRAIVSACLRLEGPVVPQELQRTLDHLIVRHEALRSRFVVASDGIELRTSRPTNCPLIVAEAVKDDSTAVERLREIGRNCLDTPFDLAHGPLIRATFVPGHGGGFLILGLHHAVSDGWSVRRLAIELTEYYGQTVSGQAQVERPHQLRDYVAWQERCRSLPAFEQALAFWEDALRGKNLMMDILPGRHANPPARNLSTLQHVRRHFGGERAHKMKTAMAARLANPFATFYCALSILLRVQTGRDQTAGAVPFLNRHMAGTRRIIGPLSNVLPCGTFVRGEMTVGEFETELRKHINDVRPYQFVHASVIGTHMATRTGSVPERPNVMFNYLFFANARHASKISFALVPDATVGVIPAWCDLAFQVYQLPDGWSIEVLGFDDLLKSEELGAFAEALETLALSCALHPTAPIRALLTSGRVV